MSRWAVLAPAFRWTACLGPIALFRRAGNCAVWRDEECTVGKVVGAFQCSSDSNHQVLVEARVSSSPSTLSRIWRRLSQARAFDSCGNPGQLPPVCCRRGIIRVVRVSRSAICRQGQVFDARACIIFARLEAARTLTRTLLALTSSVD